MLLDDAKYFGSLNLVYLTFALFTFSRNNSYELQLGELKMLKIPLFFFYYDNVI